MGRVAETEFRTVPNQRIINVNKSAGDKKNLYTIINLSSLNSASRDLQGLGSFKLYIYFMRNQDNYTFALSSADFMEWSGLSKSAYTTAFNELVSKGYLVQQKDSKNRYNFYDSPHFEAVQQEKEIITEKPTDSGFTF